MTVRHEKCWLASTTIEVLVVAETKEKATEIASEALYQEMQNNDFSEPDLVVLARYIPGGFEKDSLVYREDKADMTVVEAMALNKPDVP